MTNKNYIKGVRKERLYVNRARKLGLIAFRSAGSHSPIDVIVINVLNKRILMLQCKPESMSKNSKDKIKEQLKDLNAMFMCSFDVV